MFAEAFGRFQRRSFDAVINLLRRKPPIPERDEPLVAKRLLDAIKLVFDTSFLTPFISRT